MAFERTARNVETFARLILAKRQQKEEQERSDAERSQEIKMGLLGQIASDKSLSIGARVRFLQRQIELAGLNVQPPTAEEFETGGGELAQSAREFAKSRRAGVLSAQEEAETSEDRDFEAATRRQALQLGASRVGQVDASALSSRATAAASRALESKRRKDAVLVQKRIDTLDTKGKPETFNRNATLLNNMLASQEKTLSQVIFGDLSKNIPGLKEGDERLKSLEELRAIKKRRQSLMTKVSERAGFEAGELEKEIKGSDLKRSSNQDLFNILQGK